MAVEQLQNYRKLKHDGVLPISVGQSRQETAWKNKNVHWSTLVKKLETTCRTPETIGQFLKMSKAAQDKIKDIGGFVGGSLKGGHRKADTVECRQIVALDADYANPSLADDLPFTIDGAYCIYSTHKHQPEKPRLRILIPLDRPVSPEEYEAIARKLADKIGIDMFDDTTYQPNRLMFWPSTASDGEYVFRVADEEWTSADAVLAEYPDWTDASYWPESSRTVSQRKSAVKKQADPMEKKGLVGAFCRTYTIQEAIETFLPDTYTPCADPNRYTYANGSTSAGLVVYDDRFAYSNHATDPASGQLCNAFDLVRIHKFGSLDEDTAAGTPATSLASYRAMQDFVREDRRSLKMLRAMQQDGLTTREAQLSFVDDENEDWQEELAVNKKGEILNLLKNAVTILQNDPLLKGFRFNQLADNIEIEDDGVPWRNAGRFWKDADDAQLESYLADKYTEFTKGRIMSAVEKVADDRSYHPVLEYLDGLPDWDGVKRADTLLVDYLGAENTEYVRAVTRKTLTAAVRRVRQPGCKFDTVLVLCGPQGIGKSTLIHRLGKEWFTDSLNLADTKDKTAAEKLQGNWICEVQELAGIGAAGVKTLRSFLSTQNDKYRAAYGRRVADHPRQCIMIGTTNSEDGYLNDTDGGRRFWPVNTPCEGIRKAWFITDAEVDQIWAEVLAGYDPDDSLVLEGAAAEAAKAMQKAAMISDPREGLVAAYLDRLLPDDWYSRDLEKRRDYLYGTETPMPKAVLRRDRVTVQEIWSECLGRDPRKMEQRDTYEVKRIMAKMDGWEYSPNKFPRDAAYGGKQMRGFIRTFKK